MSKILFVTNMYPSRKYPSYGVFVKKTEDILRRENDVEVVCVVKHANVLIKFFAYITFFFKIVILGYVGKYDIVYSNFASHTSLPVRILRQLKPSLKIITNVHGNDAVPLNKKDAFLLPQTQRLLNISDLVVVPSQYFSDVIKRNFGISEKRIFIFPSAGVNIDTFKKISKTQAKKMLGLNEKDRYIGFVSRIDTKKGWDIFLRAVKIIHSRASFMNYRYVVAGDGKEYSQMRELIHELKLDEIVTLIKDADHRNLPYLYNALDIFVFASFMPSESLGLVGLEAMACEQIVIASDKYGPATYIKNGINGYTFHTGDYSALAETITNALNLDADLSNNLRNSARHTAMQYNEKVVSDKLLSIVKGLTEK